MKANRSSKDFLEDFDKIWQKGPEVKYHNPDNWYAKPLKKRPRQILS